MKNYRRLFEEIESEVIAKKPKPLNIVFEYLDGTCEMHNKKFENWEKCKEYIEDQGIKKYLKYEIVEPLVIN